MSKARRDANERAGAAGAACSQSGALRAFWLKDGAQQPAPHHCQRCARGLGGRQRLGSGCGLRRWLNGSGCILLQHDVPKPRAHLIYSGPQIISSLLQLLGAYGLLEATPGQVESIQKLLVCPHHRGDARRPLSALIGQQ